MPCATAVPSISVVIPTFNEAVRIERLIVALRTQSHPVEVIVCDGNSDDGTAQKARDAGATLVSCERGVSRQRNAGARAASGELLIFMDADDLPSPDFARRVVASYQRLPFAVACPWFVACDSGLGARLSYLFFNLLFFAGQSTLRTGSGVCLITPRAIFEQVGGFDEGLHLGEDIHYIRRASPRHGLHRHLLVSLETSGRRFQRDGALQLMLFYGRITPYILLGRWDALQRLEYRAVNERA